MPWWRCAVLAICLGGCAGPALLAPTLPETASRAVELTQTPFFPQSDFQCGPAALATLLAATAVPVTARELTPLVYLPQRRGSLQPELVAATRRYHRLPYRIDPELRALVAEVAAGRPVLVLQNLGRSWYPIWHYAVVIGYRADTDQLVLRSGTHRRQVVGSRRFLDSWALADHWGLVALAPGELPARPAAERYLQAVADLESLGQFAQALPAYRAALARWPADSRARFGVANSLLGLGRAGAAVRAYRQLLAAEPGHVAALNNLAEALAAAGCRSQALATIDRAIALPQVPPALAPLLATTRDQLLHANGNEPSQAPDDDLCEAR